MKFKENRPFYFSVVVWVATWLLAPAIYLSERHIPGLEEPSQRVSAISWLELLEKIYPVSLGIGFLLFGVFSFVTDFLAKTKMPVWLVKAILSILAFALVRFGFVLIGADMDDWLGLFRSYYICVVFIWAVPLKNKKHQPADIAATA